MIPIHIEVLRNPERKYRFSTLVATLVAPRMLLKKTLLLEPKHRPVKTVKLLEVGNKARIFVQSTPDNSNVQPS